MTFIGNGKRPKRQLAMACMTAYPSRRSINFHYCFLMVHNDTVRTLFLRKNSRTFQGHYSIFQEPPFSTKKSLESMSL